MSVKWNGAAILSKVKAAAMEGVIEATEGTRAEIQSLQENSPRSGRVYRRRGVVHVASAPGEPPAPDTSNLVRSIDTEYDRTAISGKVVLRAAYAAAQEYGTPTIAPRPSARPGLENRKQANAEAIASRISDALR